MFTNWILGITGYKVKTEKNASEQKYFSFNQILDFYKKCTVTQQKPQTTRYSGDQIVWEKA